MTVDAATACRGRIQAALKEASLPGISELDEHRAEVLARSKAEPVVFTREPRADQDVSREVQMCRDQLAKSPSPGWTLHLLYKYLHNRPEIARAVLLREGYLYSANPDLAAAMVDAVELHDLYREPELRIQRGSAVLTAKKGKGIYYDYVDGPERGRRAHILLFDRVWPAGTDPGAPLHVDLRPLSHERGFQRMRIKHLSAEHMVADLRYGGTWVPSLLDVKGTRVSFACEALPEGARERVTQARALATRRQRAVAKQRAAMVTMVEEALPFDEPITEEGQQDGNLRPAWKWAYSHGWDGYTFNDDYYRVFDLQGRPKVPQVCIDFITDTLERASGTWWEPQDRARERKLGGVDFDNMDIENRRSVDVFIRYAKEHPAWFDVYELADEERVRFFNRHDFFAHLAANADRYAPGDIVAIHGPRSDGEMHWHSFYIYDSDPVTGMPLLTASNAGRPRIRSWEGEMRAAPLRSIRARIRLRLDWLESILGRDDVVTQAGPAPLISAPI